MHSNQAACPAGVPALAQQVARRRRGGRAKLMRVMIRRRRRREGRLLLLAALPRPGGRGDGRLDEAVGGVVAEERLHVAAPCGVHDDHLDDLLALDEGVGGDGEGGGGARQDGQLLLSAGWGQRRAELVRLEPVVN